MTQSVSEYIKHINDKFQTEKAREHAYRGLFEGFLKSYLQAGYKGKIDIINEPARVNCGSPDFIVQRDGLELGYIEAKDLDNDLDSTIKSEQIQRYLPALDNFILTNYLEFRFFVRQEQVASIKLGEIRGQGKQAKIISFPENQDEFNRLLLEFAAFEGQPIKTAKELARIMAQKAALMKDVFYNVVTGSEESSLKPQLEAFKEILVHDMDAIQFSDVYAQTIAFGLFTARLHDLTEKNFSRSEALLLIPKSNPFLRQLFSYIAGNDLDHRVIWIVDALCKVFLYSDLKAILKDFGTATGQNDPILHFYETFLAEYDPNLRKSRGVWYTPEPVVNFIVRAIDDVLKTKFNLPMGIADNSKIKLENGKEVHQVQLLDVATGTGTFMAEIIKQIYRKFKGQEGVWSSYVEEDLLPRLHGFELLMASYAMCHMKLDLLLQETGYKPKDIHNPARLSVYLTNSLEEDHPESSLPFASWLSTEANQASRIKRDMPIMVAFGNPPYSGESSNKGKWAQDLLEPYKKEPESTLKLDERNSKWLNNDYMKFIRLGEYYITKQGEGILAYITSNSYLESPTFRGMRWHLLNTFDDIYILDLHGNSNRKEKTPTRHKDENVFDIREGVAIIIAVKRKGRKHSKSKKESKPLANLHHADLWGKRENKYVRLQEGSLGNIEWQKLTHAAPQYFFVPKNFLEFPEYLKGFSLNKLFVTNSVGIVTARDALTIHQTQDELEKTLQDFASLPIEEARDEYNLGEDSDDWKIHLAQNELKATELNPMNIQRIAYRPFDNRYTYYTGKAKGFICRPRGEVMQHMLKGDNRLLIFMRQYAYDVPDYCYVFCSNSIIESRMFISNRGICQVTPLYRYEKMGILEEKVPNLDKVIYDKIKEKIPELTPELLFDYIYAVLHAPFYRYRYAEFLKSDFPVIPYPENPVKFNQLAEYGAQLRELHLMESPILNDTITSYPIKGDHEVVKPRFEDGKVWINSTQYFGNIPEIAWNFYIGGYQPAQKWLKDRKNKNLTFEEIAHYQKIILALFHTDRLMQAIDLIYQST